MTFPRKIGLLALLIGCAAYASHYWGLKLPSLNWFFTFDAIDASGWVRPEIWKTIAGTLHLSNPDLPGLTEDQIGYSASILLGIVGVFCLLFGGRFEWNPVTLRRFSRFRSAGRGWVSFRILILLVVLALLDQTLAGRQALAVKYDGHWFFPAFKIERYEESKFGGEGTQETDYRALRLKFRETNQGNKVILPPIPWDPVSDSQDVQNVELTMKDGALHRPGDSALYEGQAVQFHQDKPKVQLRLAAFRKGVQEGNTLIDDANGDFAGRQIWQAGKLVETPVETPSSAEEGGPWIERVYSPAPPTWRQPASITAAYPHYLGTNSKGWDVAAILYGGMQVLLKAAVLYVTVTYCAGITLGCVMGYFGGWTDLILQRITEILSNIPLLLIIMVLAAKIGVENMSLVKVVMLYCAFSWMGVAIYLRSSTYKEKARDYVAAARVQGAGTTRVIFKHILPNSMAMVVTLLPFSITGLATSLTALDFLNFGLPDRYPSWGRLLDDGTQNITLAPWLTCSVVVVLVAFLLLITFVGEAIRDAFDPKKFTSYQ